MDWISIDEVAGLLQCSPNTLRRNETPDGRYCAIMGSYIRVWRIRQGVNWQRRYSRTEVLQLRRRMTARL
ncbi:MAG TPA: hypothetical protein VK191_11330 [Symbiobacteriaceae bacterium]|nr:hypothetical protein [Symbiobacteriaceae bacterium]